MSNGGRTGPAGRRHRRGRRVHRRRGPPPAACRCRCRASTSRASPDRPGSAAASAAPRRRRRGRPVRSRTGSRDPLSANVNVVKGSVTAVYFSAAAVESAVGKPRVVERRHDRLRLGIDEDELVAALHGSAEPEPVGPADPGRRLGNAQRASLVAIADAHRALVVGDRPLCGGSGEETAPQDGCDEGRRTCSRHAELLDTSAVIDYISGRDGITGTDPRDRAFDSPRRFNHN